MSSILARAKSKLLQAADRELKTLSMDLVSVCNIACETCSLKDYYPKKRSPRIEWQTLENLVWAFQRCSSIDLQTNCEPLLHKQVVEIVRFIKEHTPGRVGFVTNATRLTEEKAEQLIEAGLDRLGVSFDGATKETFEEIRVGADFDLVVKNVRGLTAVKQRLGVGHPELAIGAVALKKNLHELVAIVELAADLGAEAVWMNGVEPYFPAMVEQVVYTPPGTENPLAEKFDEVRRRADQLGLRCYLSNPVMQPYSNCDLRGTVIDAGGNVYPCGSLSYDRPFYYLGELDHHPAVTFGCVAEQPFEAVWNSPEYRKFREDLRAGDLPETCRTCLFNHQVTCASE